MFNKPTGAGNGRNGPQRRPSADVARIEGGGLVHVLVTSFNPITFYMFVNDIAISQMEVESFEVNIDVGSEGQDEPVVRAALTKYVTSVTGDRVTQYTNLFPSTIEIVAKSRRILITAENSDSVDNLFVSLGLRQDGTSNDLKGLRSLHVIVTNELIDAALQWEDGVDESLFPL